MRENNVPFERLGDIWFPLRRGTVREGFSILALTTEDPSAYGTSPKPKGQASPT
ncbi:MAG: hypothetical protein AAGA83_09155 [Cyanobacteria bacterium P01_F01_bin.116]